MDRYVFFRMIALGEADIVVEGKRTISSQIAAKGRKRRNEDLAPRLSLATQMKGRYNALLACLGGAGLLCFNHFKKK
jgi:hypothetical protein